MIRPRSSLSTTATLVGLSLVLAACTGSDSPSSSTPPDPTSSETADHGDGHGDEHGDGHDDDFGFGMPADPADADRTIEIAGVDIAWEPTTLSIAVGETVTFVVTNEGAIAHDFFLGTQAMQDAHEEEMADHMPMHDEPNGFFLDPGETKSMTWTFTEAGEVLYGCHQEGHYDAGMVGTITVSP